VIDRSQRQISASAVTVDINASLSDDEACCHTVTRDESFVQVRSLRLLTVGDRASSVRSTHQKQSGVLVSTVPSDYGFPSDASATKCAPHGRQGS
jgi:hypothetical protein